MTQRKPTAIKVLQGNPGKKRLNRNEPKPPTPINPLEPPDFLGEFGKRRWRQLSTELHSQGLLTEWDYDTFSAYCDAYEEWVSAKIEMKATKRYQAANQQVSDLYTRLVQSRKEMVRIGALHGLNPSARAGLDVRKASKDCRSDAEIDFGMSAS